MLCENCKADVAADALYCPNCGEPTARPSEDEADRKLPLRATLLAIIVIILLVLLGGPLRPILLPSASDYVGIWHTSNLSIQGTDQTIGATMYIMPDGSVFTKTDNTQREYDNEATNYETCNVWTLSGNSLSIGGSGICSNARISIGGGSMSERNIADKSGFTVEGSLTTWERVSSTIYDVPQISQYIGTWSLATKSSGNFDLSLYPDGTWSFTDPSGDPYPYPITWFVSEDGAMLICDMNDPGYEQNPHSVPLSFAFALSEDHKSLVSGLDGSEYKKV